jgi:hypothetical protein
MKMAGASLLPKAVRPSNVVAEKLAELPLQAPLQGALGGAGEAAGQQMAGDELKPGAILAEMFGEFAGTPHEAATAIMSKPHVAGAPTQPGTPATEADIAAQVAAGGIQVDTGPGSPTTPLPTNTPVTAVADGVKTTTTLHGPAGAYTTQADETGKPTLKPTMSPGEWIDHVNETATSLYPDVAGPTGEAVISPQAMAFENGAHGYPVNQGLPLDTPIETVMGAYAEGQQFAAMPQAAERESVPVEGLYSRVRRWAETAPTKLPAHEWAAKLRNNNAFKGEEVQDLYLDQYLEGRAGQTVTRED